MTEKYCSCLYGSLLCLLLHLGNFFHTKWGQIQGSCYSLQVSDLFISMESLFSLFYRPRYLGWHSGSVLEFSAWVYVEQQSCCSGPGPKPWSVFLPSTWRVTGIIKCLYGNNSQASVNNTFGQAYHCISKNIKIICASYPKKIFYTRFWFVLKTTSRYVIFRQAY